MTWRYLRGNKSSESPRTIFCVDTETRRTPGAGGQGYDLEEFRLGVVRVLRLAKGVPTCRAILAFDQVDQFWAFVARHSERRARNLIFSHGLGFDLRALDWFGAVDSGLISLIAPPSRDLQQATGSTARKPRTGLLVLDGPPTIVDCWLRDGSPCRFVDSLNWWCCPLTELGRHVGLGKLPIPDPWDSDSAWITYCARDCEILEAAIIGLFAWHAKHDLGVWKPTAPGQAMQAYRHRFMSAKICFHDEPDVSAIERSAYYAGRLSSFYLGEIRSSTTPYRGQLFDKFDSHAPRPYGPVYKLDSNSLFPSVMRGNLYPTKLADWRIVEPDAWRPPWTLDATYAAEVELRSSDREYPVRHRGRSLHATGHFRTALCGPELAQASQRGEIISIGSWACYELAEIFTSYVDYFWQLRWMEKLAGNELYSGLCKRMLNSLYGKFAQRAYEWEDDPNQAPPEPWATWFDLHPESASIREYRAIGERVQYRQPPGEHPQAFPAIAAWVTAYARELMRTRRETAGFHNVYYQGVDSLMVSSLGLERLTAAGEVDSAALGKLRLEGVSDEATIVGLGYYCFGGALIRSSVRRDAVEIDALQIEQDTFERLAASCRHHPSAGVRVMRVRRQTPAEPDLSGCTEHGWVKPIVLSLADQRSTDIDPADVGDDPHAAGTQLERTREWWRSTSRRSLTPGVQG